MVFRAWMVLVTVLVPLAGDCCFAIPAEQDAFPSAGHSEWSWQYNQTFRRDFNKQEGKAATRQGFLKAAYAVTDTFFLDGKIGSGDVIFRRTDGIDHRFPAGFAGGYGFRYFWRDVLPGSSVVAGFQHISCHPFKHTVNDVAYRVIWDEWQGTLVWRLSIPRGVFYFGPQYSTCQLKFTQDDFRRRLKAEDSWGGLAGWSGRVYGDVRLTAEARLFDEWGLSAGVNIGF